MCVCVCLELVLEMINGRLMEVKAFVLLLYVFVIASGSIVGRALFLCVCVRVFVTERVRVCVRRRESRSMLSPWVMMNSQCEADGQACVCEWIEVC